MNVLETERLRLRWFCESDAPFVRALVNDPAWIANIGDRGVRDDDDARRFIAERLVASYWKNGHGLWAMERRSDGALVGMCGLVDRDSLPAIDVGYALAPEFRGSGYVREAAAACLSYAKDALGRSRVIAIVRPNNAPSVRVLESLGMTQTGKQISAESGEEVAVFAWGEERAEIDPRVAIDALAARFFASFDNRGGTARVAAVSSMFLPDAIVTIASATAVQTLSVRDFVAPRAELLTGGRLVDFEEHEVASDTQVTGHLARRACRYTKRGVLDGVPFEGGGFKELQLVRTRRGWKIAALAWEDNPAA